MFILFIHFICFIAACSCRGLFAVADTKKRAFPYLYSRKVKVLDVFCAIRAIFLRIFDLPAAISSGKATGGKMPIAAGPAKEGA